jgi:hypothetical protein
MLSTQAKQVAATPFTPYTGEMVAGLTPSQQAGIQNINSASAEAQPYYQAGAGLVGNAATPFGQQQLSQYMSPYINSVAAATQANLNETNAQQRQQLLGNAISQGAFGGDRAGIAQAELARQQDLAGGQTMANIYQGGYGQALAQFNADQARQLQAGSQLGQLGTGAQTAGLAGGQAQMAAGATQQAVQQAQDVANQQQFQAQQAYPFQTTQYLANLLLGIGGQSGGTALTAQPQGNIGSSLVGGLLTAGSLFKPFNKGGVVPHDDSMGGAVHEGDDRKGYALQGGVDSQYGVDVPYSDQPTGGSTKQLSLADIMRVRHLGKSSPGWTTKPSAPSLSDEGEIDPSKVLNQAMADPYERANLRGWGNKLIGNTPGTVSASDVIPDTNYAGQTSLPGMLGRYASGGVVGRHGYEGDGFVPPANPYAAKLGTLADAIAQQYQDLNAQPDPNRPKTIAETIVGHPLSDEANMGLLSAGLAMMGNKSPIFGIGVGQGAQAGLGTYYNALKNKRDFGEKLLERESNALGTASQAAYQQGELGLRGEQLKQEQFKTAFDLNNKLQEKWVPQDPGDMPDEIRAQNPNAKNWYKNASTGQTISEDQYFKIFEDNASLLRLPRGLSSVLRSNTIPSREAKGGRIGLALGGVDPSAAPEDDQVSGAIKDKQDMSKLISSTLGAGEGDVDKTQPRVQVADALGDIVKNAKPSKIFPDMAPTGTPDYWNSVADYWEKKNKWLSGFGSSREREAASALENASKYRKLATDIANGEAPTQLVDPDTGEPAGMGKSPSAVAAAQQRTAEGTKKTEISKNEAADLKEFNDETKKFFPAYEKDTQLLDTLTKIYQNVSSNNLSGLRAQLIGYMQSAGIDHFGNISLEQIQSGDATAVKAATSQAIETVAAELGRSPAVGLKTSLKTVASPDLPPTSRYQLIQNAYAELMQERDLRKAWLDAGKPDPVKFQADWYGKTDDDGVPLHDLNAYRQYVTENKLGGDKGLFPGMNEESMKNLLNKPTKLWDEKAANPNVPAGAIPWNPKTGFGG